MRATFPKILQLVLNYLLKRGLITVRQAELLYQLLISSKQQQIDNEEYQVLLDKERLEGKIDGEQYYKARLKAGLSEHSMHPREYLKDSRGLIEMGALIEKEDGVAPIEPPHHVPLEILLNRTPLEPVARDLPQLTRNISRLGSLTGIIVPLPKRQRIVSEVNLKLSDSPSILLSKSPSIFNPEEFESQYKNYTELLAHSIKKASQPLLYFWDYNSVCLQIQKHLEKSTSGVDNLIEKYKAHFLPYAQNENLTVICGKNSVVIEDWELLPFLAKDFYIQAERENGKLERGVLVDWRRFERYIGDKSFLKAAKLIPEIWFEKRYEEVQRKMLDDPDSIKLHQHDETSVSMFIEKIFKVVINKGIEPLDI